jgi:hypothetical protein
MKVHVDDWKALSGGCRCGQNPEGQLAGDCTSPWSRRMKIGIHDIDPLLLQQAVRAERAIELTINGTGADGTPVCATVEATKRCT